MSLRIFVSLSGFRRIFFKYMTSKNTAQYRTCLLVSVGL